MDAVFAQPLVDGPVSINRQVVAHGEWSPVEDGYSIVVDTSWIIVIDLVE